VLIVLPFDRLPVPVKRRLTMPESRRTRLSSTNSANPLLRSSSTSSDLKDGKDSRRNSSEDSDDEPLGDGNVSDNDTGYDQMEIKGRSIPTGRSSTRCPPCLPDVDESVSSSNRDTGLYEIINDTISIENEIETRVDPKKIVRKHKKRKTRDNKLEHLQAPLLPEKAINDIIKSDDLINQFQRAVIENFDLQKSYKSLRKMFFILIAMCILVLVTLLLLLIVFTFSSDMCTTSEAALTVQQVDARIEALTTDIRDRKICLDCIILDIMLEHDDFVTEVNIEDGKCCVKDPAKVLEIVIEVSSHFTFSFRYSIVC